MRVPVYDSPQVAPAQQPDAQLHVDTRGAFGEQIGQGLQEVGQGLQMVRERAAVSSATDNINAWENKQLDRQHGSADGKTKGFFQLQGKEAIAASTPTISAMQQDQQDMVKDIADPEAKRIFLAHTNSLLLGHRREIEEYTGQQLKLVNQASAAASSDTAVRVAAQNPSSDVMVNDAEETGRAAIVANLHGMPPEVVQDQLAKMRQNITAARINALLAPDRKDYVSAQAILDAQRDRLGPEAAELSGRIEARKDQYASGQIADQAFAAGVTDKPRQYNSSAAYAFIDQQPSGPLREKAREVLNARVKDHLEGIRQADENDLAQVNSNTIAARGVLDEGSPLFQQMSVRGQEAARQHAISFLRSGRMASQEDRIAQKQVDDVIKETAKAMSDADLVKANIDYDFAGASPWMRQYIQAQQKNANARLVKGQTPKFNEFEDMVNSAAGDSNIAKGDARRDQLMRSMKDWWEQTMEKTNVAPTRSEIDKRLAGELQTGDGMLWGSDNTFRFEREAAGQTFTPGKPENQVYPPNKAPSAAPTVQPAVPTTRVQPPTAAPSGITRVKNGKLIVWDGKKWVAGE